MAIFNAQPLVSVAVITYNQKNYLKECLETVLAQDYENFEIVVADDGSSDGTQEILHEYATIYPDKFVLKLAEKNQGITLNCNAAHFACSGKYIAWMGGDDLMLPGKIKKQVDFMESNPDCTICYHNLEVFDSDSNSTLYYFNKKRKLSGDVRTVIREGNFNGACSNMVRADRTPETGFNILIPVASDWLYWIDSLAKGGEICYLDEVLGRYRRHVNNVTNKSNFISQNEIDHLNSCQIVLSMYPRYFNDVMVSYSRSLLSLRHKLNYLNAVWRSFCIRPSIRSSGALAVYILTFSIIKL